MKKITIVLVGVIFLSGCVGQQQTSSQSQPEKQKTANQKTAEKIPDVVPEAKEGPKEVAASYANLTLMTFPTDARAKEYLAPDLQTKFNTTGFVPQSYGIQNTPDSINVDEANVSGTKATVKVTGQFGQTQITWEFTLSQFNGEWKISTISKK